MKRKDTRLRLIITGRLPSRGYAPAQNRLGVLHQDGYGVSKDYAQAVTWYRRAAEQGYALAERGLGFMYRFGHGVNQDYIQALNWYRKAAEQGFCAGAE